MGIFLSVQSTSMNLCAFHSLLDPLPRWDRVKPFACAAQKHRASLSEESFRTPQHTAYVVFYLKLSTTSKLNVVDNISGAIGAYLCIFQSERQGLRGPLHDCIGGLGCSSTKGENEVGRGRDREQRKSMILHHNLFDTTHVYTDG